MSERRGWFARASEGVKELAGGGFGFAVSMGLMIPDIGHAGYLFAAREAADRKWIGYWLSGLVDAVFAIAFGEIVRVRRAWHKALYVFIAVLACGVNIGFNYGYFRNTMPSDPLWLSLLLAAACPGLAALLSVARAFKETEAVEREEVAVERAEAATAREADARRTHELEMRELELAAEVKKAAALEVERTRQMRIEAQVTKLQAEEARRQAEEAERLRQEAQEAERLRQEAEALKKEMPQPIATIQNWRAIIAQGNGKFAQADADCVQAALEEAGLAAPSRRTMLNWAREARIAPLPVADAGAAREEGKG